MVALTESLMTRDTDELADLLAVGNRVAGDYGMDEEEAGDAAFLHQLLQELEGDATSDPLDGLDDSALRDGVGSDDELYWEPEDGDDDEADEAADEADDGHASDRSGQAARTRSRKRKRQSYSRIETLFRSGRVPHQRIRSAVNRVRMKSDIARQRPKRVQDSFLLHPSEHASAQAAAAHGAESNKPEVVRRTRTNLEHVEHLRNKASAAKSEWGQAYERLGMLTHSKSQDVARVAQQREEVLQCAAALMTANSEMLRAQVCYQRKKLPAGAFYMFKEGGKTQGPFSAHQLIKVGRQLALAQNTEVLVDSSVMKEGTMWVYLGTLLPLLEDSSNLRNVTQVAEPRSRRANGGAPAHPARGNQDGDDAGRDGRGDQGDGRDGNGAGQSLRRSNDGSGSGGRWNDSSARARGSSAGLQRNAHRQKRIEQQRKYEEASAMFEEELTLEMYTLETKEGEMWGPHSYEALENLVERKEIFEDVDLMYENDLGVSTITYVDLHQRIKEKREKVQRLRQQANDASLEQPAAQNNQSQSNGDGRGRGTPPPPPGPPSRGAQDGDGGWAQAQSQSPLEGPTADPEPSATSPEGMPAGAELHNNNSNSNNNNDALPGPPATQTAAAAAPPDPLPGPSASDARSDAPLPLPSVGSTPPGIPPGITPPHSAELAPPTFAPSGTTLPPAGLPPVGAPVSAPAPAPAPATLPAVPKLPIGIETVNADASVPAAAAAAAAAAAPQQPYPAPQFPTPQQPPGYGVADALAPATVPAHLPGVPVPGVPVPSVPVPSVPVPSVPVPSVPVPSVPVQYPAQQPADSQAPAAVAALLPSMPAQPPAQVPLEPQQSEELDDDFDNMTFDSFEELLQHVQENEMDHMYQVFLERFGKQRPRRMGRLDVVALIEYKDAPLHIAQQAVKDFVEDPTEPEDASETFRRLLKEAAG